MAFLLCCLMRGQEVADTAATAVSRGALFGSLALLLGAVAGWFGGRMGAVEPTITARMALNQTTGGPIGYGRLARGRPSTLLVVERHSSHGTRRNTLRVAALVKPVRSSHHG